MNNIYNHLYAGKFRGDTWTLPENSNLNPRARVVEEVIASFNKQLSVLDIGCGKGLNTLSVVKNGGTWTGVDVASADELNLKLPANAKFIQGEFANKEVQNKLGNYDLIVDQGAVIVEMDTESEINNYVAMIHKMLNESGRLVILLMNKFENDNLSSVIFPDGRKRALWTPTEIAALFSEHFEIESGLEYENGYSVMPGVKNPLGAKNGDARQVTLFHMVFKKK